MVEGLPNTAKKRGFMDIALFCMGEQVEQKKDRFRGLFAIFVSLDVFARTRQVLRSNRVGRARAAAPLGNRHAAIC